VTLNNLVRSVRFTGSIGVVGVYVPADPGGPDELARRGEVAFDFGLYWFKGQRMGTGQCPVKAYNRYLRELIHTGKATPSFVVSHELPLDRPPRATSTSTRAATAGPRWSWPPPPDWRHPRQPRHGGPPLSQYRRIEVAADPDVAGCGTPPRFRTTR